MIIKWLKKVISNTQEVNEIGLYTIMSDADLMGIFQYTPLYYTMLPMLGLLFTVSAFFKGYDLVKASNKNLDQWFGFIVSAVCATLASVSLYGAVLATFYGFEFAMGPWLFLASSSIALLSQVTMLAVNGYRAYESLSHSSQRMHYLQAALNNLYHVGFAIALTGAAFFVMLSPAAPAIGIFCAFTALGMTAASSLWKLLPVTWKRTIKSFIGLGKPEFDASQSVELIPDDDHKRLNPAPEYHYQRLFTKKDHRAEIQFLSFKEGCLYLQKEIQLKINRFESQVSSQCDKNKQKIALLTELSQALNSTMSFSKEGFLKQYPLAYQSFWSEQGEVEQLVNAAECLKDKVTTHESQEARYPEPVF